VACVVIPASLSSTSSVHLLLLDIFVNLDPLPFDPQASELQQFWQKHPELSFRQALWRNAAEDTHSIILDLQLVLALPMFFLWVSPASFAQGPSPKPYPSPMKELYPPPTSPMK
jgi:hypothetical protein